MNQIPINLVSGVSCTIRANDGLHCAYNLLDAPPKYRQTAFVVLSPPITTKSVLAISSEDSESKQ